MQRLLMMSVAVGVACAGPASAQSQQEEIRMLRQQLEAMQQRLEQLETQQSQQRERIADTEERVGTVVSEAGDPIVTTDRRNVRLAIGGRVNAAFLYADQGGDRGQPFIVDNDGSGSRFEFLAEKDFGPVTSGLEIVVSAEVNSTDEIEFGENNDNADENADLGSFRQAHWFIEHEDYGYFSIGQGDTAAEDTAHVDLSGTDFAGAGSDVDDLAGGLEFFADDGMELAELDDFFDMQDGSRSLRALYVSPSVYGVSVAGSLANDDQSFESDDDLDGDGLQPSVALLYGGEFAGGYEVEAAASYRREDDVVVVDGANDIDVDDDFLVGSASVLMPFGLNLTVAGSVGFLDDDGFDVDVDNPTALFGKIGYREAFFGFGDTRFSFDVFRGRNNPDFASPEGELPEALSFGLFAVQAVEPLGAEFYVGGRVYSLDEVYVDGESTEPDDLWAITTGARVRF